MIAPAIIPMTALLLGIGAYVYFTREEEVSTSTGNGGPAPPPPHVPGEFLTAATVQEHEENVAKMLNNPKPIVLIVFKAGQIGGKFADIQEAGQQAAEDFSNVWVVAETEAVRLQTGSQGVPTHCAEADIGYVLAAPFGGGAGSEVGVNCWGPTVPPVKIRQDIYAAAASANALVGTA